MEDSLIPIQEEEIEQQKEADEDEEKEKRDANLVKEEIDKVNPFNMIKEEGKILVEGDSLIIKKKVD